MKKYDNLLLMAKVILIISDGMPDRPIFHLENKTPLELAYTPNMDYFARKGISGLMHTVGVGIRPGSDVAHLSIFGYDPKKFYKGRGPFEAIGYGAKLKEHDIAFRANFASVNGNKIITDRRAGRIDDTGELINLINSRLSVKNIKAVLTQGKGHRAVLVLSGDNLSPNISDTDPKKEGHKLLSAKPLDPNDTKAVKTAKLVNQISEQVFDILNKSKTNEDRMSRGLLPANMLLFRGAGENIRLPDFRAKWGLKACCIAGAGLYKGIARACNMDILKIASATGNKNTDIPAKIDTAIKALNKYDFVFVHIKAADSLAEDGNYKGKTEFIGKIDKALEPLKKIRETLIVITSDHTTSSILKQHTADPVPVLFYKEGIHCDQIKNFSEKDAHRGRIGHIKGLNLMPIILDLIGKAPLYGA